MRKASRSHLKGSGAHKMSKRAHKMGKRAYRRKFYFQDKHTASQIRFGRQANKAITQLKTLNNSQSFKIANSLKNRDILTYRNKISQLMSEQSEIY